MAKIEDEFSKITDNSIALVIFEPVKYQQASLDLLNYILNEKKFGGVYISVNKPYENLINFLKENEIDVNNLFVIDTATAKCESTQKYLCTTPQSLTEISIALSQLTQIMPGPKRFLLIDSLSTLLVYNSPAVVLRFIHFIVTNLRNWRMMGILLATKEDAYRGFLAQVSQFCDKVLEV